MFPVSRLHPEPRVKQAPVPEISPSVTELNTRLASLSIQGIPSAPAGDSPAVAGAASAVTGASDVGGAPLTPSLAFLAKALDSNGSHHSSSAGGCERRFDAAVGDG